MLYMQTVVRITPFSLESMTRFIQDRVLFFPASVHRRISLLWARTTVTPCTMPASKAVTTTGLSAAHGQSLQILQRTHFLPPST